MAVDVEEDYRPPPTTTFVINVRTWTDNNKRTTCWARLNDLYLRVNLSIYSMDSSMEGGTNLDN